MFTRIRPLFVWFGFLIALISGGATAQNTTFFLYAGSVVRPDTPTCSPNKKYCFVFQSGDGNMVVYRVGTPNVAIWNAGSFGAIFAVLQPDGNFVAYRAHGGNPADAVFSTSAGKPTGTRAPTGQISDNGVFSITHTTGWEWKTPADPQYVPEPAIPSCPTARQFAICTFPGTRNQFNGWILACNPTEAQYLAQMTGSTYGRCPGT